MPNLATCLYVGALAAVALVVSVVSVANVAGLVDVALFAALVFLAEQAKARVQSRAEGDLLASLASVIAVATYPVLGMWGAPVLLASLLVFRSPTPLVKRIYNVSQNVLCTFLGGAVYVALGGQVGAVDGGDFPYILVPITAANLVWHLANYVLLAGVLRLDMGAGPLRVWRSLFAKALGAFIGYSYLGFLMGVLWLGQLGPFAALFLLPPLFVANWAFAQYGAEQKAHQATLQALAQAIETKDLYTRGHGERVSKAARMLGAEMGWDGARLEALAEAGLLHDVGKIGVPTRILQKDGRLSEEEYDAIKLHPLHGVEVVGDIAFLEDARAGIMHHHERYDGTGYPSGLRGADIPIFARVLAISDAFDCMTSLRSYRPARPVEEALEELIRCRGTHFDPDLVDLFVSVIRRDGWSPAKVPHVPSAQATAPAYDHDDPTHPPQVEERSGGTP